MIRRIVRWYRHRRRTKAWARELTSYPIGHPHRARLAAEIVQTLLVEAMARKHFGKDYDL